LKTSTTTTVSGGNAAGAVSDATGGIQRQTHNYLDVKRMNHNRASAVSIEDLNYKFYHKIVTKGLTTGERVVYDSVLALKGTAKAAVMRSLILGMVNTIDHEYTPAEIEGLDRMLEADCIDPSTVPVPLQDTIHARVRAIFGEKFYFEDMFEMGAKAAITPFGTLLYHPKQNVAMIYCEHMLALGKFQQHYASIEKYSERVEKMVGSMMHLVATHRPKGVFTKVFPQKITADPVVKGQRKIKGPAAQILMWGIQFVRYGSFSAPGIEAYTTAFEFPQLAVTVQSPSAAGLYAALVGLKAGRELIDKVSTAYDNNITECVSDRDIEGLFAREDGLLDLTAQETHFNTEKVYMDMHGSFLRGDLLPSIGKDKGIMRSIGMLLKPHGTMVASIGASLFRLGGAHLLASEWESVAALDATNMLGLKVSVSDGKISPGRTGVPRPPLMHLTMQPTCPLMQ